MTDRPTCRCCKAELTHSQLAPFCGVCFHALVIRKTNVIVCSAHSAKVEVRRND